MKGGDGRFDLFELQLKRITEGRDNGVMRMRMHEAPDPEGEAARILDEYLRTLSEEGIAAADVANRLRID